MKYTHCHILLHSPISGSSGSSGGGRLSNECRCHILSTIRNQHSIHPDRITSTLAMTHLQVSDRGGGVRLSSLRLGDTSSFLISLSAGPSEATWGLNAKHKPNKISTLIISNYGHFTYLTTATAGSLIYETTRSAWAVIC